MLAADALLHAQYASPIITKDVTTEQKLNNPVPLDLFFRDEANQTVALRTYFGKSQSCCRSCTSVALVCAL